MRADRQRRAWQELELGPLWRRREQGSFPIGEHLPREVPVIGEQPRIAEPVDTGQPFDIRVQGQAAQTAWTGDIAHVFAGSEPDGWLQVRQEVGGCRRCGLCETRNRTVFGSGPQRARWMLIGEAPGADEDVSGEPFVGLAGRLLDRMLASIGLSRRDDVFITNVLKCRPPGNRNPQPLEAATCSSYLYRQIDLVKPDLLLLLGRFAVQSVLKTDSSLAGLRGRVHRYAAADGDIPVVCTYHPAYLLRNLPEKKKSWEDLCFAVDVAARHRALRHEGEAGV